VALAAAAFNSVTFKQYSDAACQTLNTTRVQKCGACSKEERPGHYRMLNCSDDGKTITDTEYSDADCKTKVHSEPIPAGKCHEGAGHSVMVTCTMSQKFDHHEWAWTDADVAAYYAPRGNFSAGCIDRGTVMSRVVAKANGQYCECVCPHLSPWRCDCSGITSYGWELAAPGLVTSTLPGVSSRLGGWADMDTGDIILHPSQHVEVFHAWESGKTTFGYCGCHNTADGCSCRTGSTSSYWQANGYYPAKGHMVC